MILDGVTAGLLPKQPHRNTLGRSHRHSPLHLPGALDDKDKATAKLYVQKAVQAAEAAWQQTIGGLQKPHSISPRTSQLRLAR